MMDNIDRFQLQMGSASELAMMFILGLMMFAVALRQLRVCGGVWHIVAGSLLVAIFRALDRC